MSLVEDKKGSLSLVADFLCPLSILRKAKCPLSIIRKGNVGLLILAIRSPKYVCHNRRVGTMTHGSHIKPHMYIPWIIPRNDNERV